MKPWQFSKPKGPGFGLSSKFYLSIFAVRPLPNLLAWLNPKGEGDAVPGFGIPTFTNDKGALQLPMIPGIYGLASKDRKTVLRCLVMNPSQAGFNPYDAAQAPEIQSLGSEISTRMTSCTTIIQLSFETYEPSVVPATHFLLDLAVRLGQLTEGLVCDPICMRYGLPTDFIRPMANSGIPTELFVVARSRTKVTGLHAFTLGLQKFLLPELEIEGLQPANEQASHTFLLSAAQAMLSGNILQEGSSVGSRRIPFEARVGGLDGAFWRGLSVMELVPPLQATPDEAVNAWFEEAR